MTEPVPGWPMCPTCGMPLERSEIDTGLPGTSGYFPILACPNGHDPDARKLTG